MYEIILLEVVQMNNEKLLELIKDVNTDSMNLFLVLFDSDYTVEEKRALILEFKNKVNSIEI